MIFNIVQYFIKKFRPAFYGLITRMVYYGKRVKIGKNFRTDSVPKLIIDQDCQLVIGNDVELRRNVEIRSHGQSKIIIGSNVRIDRGVRILAANNAKIDIGNKVRIGLYTVFNGGDSIIIKENTLISGFVYLQTSMHGYVKRDAAIQNQGYLHQPIFLSEDVWLGTHVVVLPGIVIGNGAVVGSNAVVTKNVESYMIVAGIPAKILKER